MEWLPERPVNGLLSDAAIIFLIVPGSILSWILLLNSSAPWYVFVLIAGIDLTICTLFVLMALYLNRYLRYRISEVGIEVRAMRGWILYPREEISQVRLESLEVNPFVGLKLGLGGLSGMLHGRYMEKSLGWVQFHGYSQGSRGMILFRKQAIPVILTPERIDDFLAYLLALEYPLGG
jgi:hypothetical protein